MPREEDIAKGAPWLGGYGSFLNNLLTKAGISRKESTLTNTICCQPPGGLHPSDVKWHYTSRGDARSALAYCSHHFLEPIVRGRTWDKIIAVGEQALQALTNRKGILVWRGSPLPTKWDNSQLKVLPTLHPTDLFKDMNMSSVVVNDLRKQPLAVPENYNLYADADALSRFTSPVVSLDFEWDGDENVTIAGVSGRFYEALVGTWDGTSNTEQFRRILEEATDLIGHNLITAECKHIDKWGWKLKARLHDTMLKQHLLQPSFKHGLGFVGSVYTNKVFWKGKGIETEDQDGQVEVKYQWRTWNTPEAIPRSIGGYGGCSSADEAFRLYNARDTEGTFQINHQLDVQLQKWDLEKIYWNVALPIAHICSDISDAGIRINHDKLAEIREELQEEITKNEQLLPEGLRPFEKPITRSVPAPAGTYKQKSKICKGKRKAAHDPITFTFRAPGETAECPSCGRVLEAGKISPLKRVKVPDTEIVRPYMSSPKVMVYARAQGLKIPVNRKRGTEAAYFNARKGWARTNPEFRILDNIKDAATELNTFAKEAMQGVDRLYFRLNPTGTSEGRFSSSGKRKGIDPNIQNQPDSTRKIYVPDQATYSLIELDYSSGENFLTAYLANDYTRLSRLRTPGYSEHLELARQIFDCPDLTKSPEDIREFWGQRISGYAAYDIGKHANHGGNYGMTHVKLQEYLEMNGIFFSTKQCKDIIEARKALNPETSRWQDETIRRAERDGYLRNPFGRIRWFSTRDISTKALAFLPASTLADIIIRAMIAHYPHRFSAECVNLGLTKVSELCYAWRIAAQIHDSLVMQGPHDEAMEQARRTKALMEQPWTELQGFSLGVEVKMGVPGASWGELKKVVL